MFEIDTGTQTAFSKSNSVRGNGRIDLVGQSEWSERFHRQMIARLWNEAESVADVDTLIAAEDLVIDALWFAFPHYAERIDEAANELRALFREAESAPADDPRPAEPGTPTAQSGKDGKDDNDDFFF